MQSTELDSSQKVMVSRLFPSFPEAQSFARQVVLRTNRSPVVKPIGDAFEVSGPDVEEGFSNSGGVKTQDVHSLPKEFSKQPFAIEQDIARVLSGEDIALLKKYGCWLQALESGEVPITSEAHHHFIEAVNGRTVPMTPYEKSWIRYKNCVARRLIEKSCGGVSYSRDHGYYGSFNSDAYDP